MNKNTTFKGILLAGIAMGLACLPVLAAPQPAKVRVATHYLVPVKSGPDAARSGHPGKAFEMTEIRTSNRPVIKKRHGHAHHRVYHRDRFSTMRETIKEAARKQ